MSLILTEATWHAARTERDRRRAHHVRTTGALGTTAPAAARGQAADRPGGTPSDPHTSATTAACSDLVTTSSDGTSTSADFGAVVTTPRTTTAGAGEEAAAYEPATLEDGTPVPPSELARAMCDCDVTRIVIDADGTPLDLGRTRRLFTGPQRRAVIARDRECIWPGCHAPARWCEIHHTRWWERDGGPTSVDTGALICSYHHHETHRRDLTITRHTHAPSGAGPGRRPAATVAAVHYEFRDRTGRLVGPAPPPEPDHGQPPTTRPRRGPDNESPRTASARAGREPPGTPTLEWTTDPMTGMRVPAFLLGQP